MRDEETREAATPPVLSRDDLEKLRQEEAEISRKVARDIEVLRRRDPQDRMTRWR